MSSLADQYRRRGQLQGACLCGAVQISIDGDYVAAVGACHCSRCQRSAGVLWGAFVGSAPAVTVTGEVARYASTEFSERAFCPICGSNLWLRDSDNDAADYEFMPALFPEAAAFPLISEIYTDCRPAYVPLSGSHATKTRAEWEADNRHVEGDMP
ncbi:GFA family protein [Fontisubflavum oceani]|uniref:GFA family protein n=1 Tax=Fontisubflavum oceani TaxID=2978973 RepID=UPI0025B58EEF|nr:GFA family protein [Fontisubflavum oceani]WJY22504.1 GFA family protein [Fontisubflavum oceani]